MEPKCLEGPGDNFGQFFFLNLCLWFKILVQFSLGVRWVRVPLVPLEVPTQRSQRGKYAFVDQTDMDREPGGGGTSPSDSKSFIIAHVQVWVFLHKLFTRSGPGSLGSTPFWLLQGHTPLYKFTHCTHAQNTDCKDGVVAAR